MIIEEVFDAHHDNVTCHKPRNKTQIHFTFTVLEQPSMPSIHTYTNAHSHTHTNTYSHQK